MKARVDGGLIFLTVSMVVHAVDDVVDGLQNGSPWWEISFSAALLLSGVTFLVPEALAWWDSWVEKRAVRPDD